jgi:hypothetical protein
VQRFVFANNINPIFNSEVQKVGKYRWDSTKTLVFYL